MFDQLIVYIARACVCTEQRHKAALTPNILSCIEDCIAVTNRVMNDLHCNIWLVSFMLSAHVEQK